MTMANKKTTKYVLSKKEAEKTTTEYYTYLDEQGVEHKYTGILSKSADNVYGKTIETNKVMLNYYPAIETVIGKPSMFTYLENGIEQRYLDKPMYDEETNTYFGIKREFIVNNTVIDIFEEK